MFSIGMLVGGVAPNIKIASVLASVLYFPMLIFSGATLPYEVMPTALQRVADVMPLTQGIKLLKSTSIGLPIDNVLVPVVVMTLIALVCTSTSIRFFKWE
jgi:ABC-2 type transport system permease protein